jgi:hypothetical protein
VRAVDNGLVCKVVVVVRMVGFVVAVDEVVVVVVV